MVFLCDICCTEGLFLCLLGMSYVGFFCFRHWWCFDNLKLCLRSNHSTKPEKEKREGYQRTALLFKYIYILIHTCIITSLAYRWFFPFRRYLRTTRLHHCDHKQDRTNSRTGFVCYEHLDILLHFFLYFLPFINLCQHS